jgi:hypothetical protein
MVNGKFAHSDGVSHIRAHGYLRRPGFRGDLLYAAAEYEHMSGWKWALASVAVSLTIRGLFPLSFIFVLPAQSPRVARGIRPRPCPCLRLLVQLSLQVGRERRVQGHIDHEERGPGLR